MVILLSTGFAYPESFSDNFKFLMIGAFGYVFGTFPSWWILIHLCFFFSDTVFNFGCYHFSVEVIILLIV